MLYDGLATTEALLTAIHCSTVSKQQETDSLLLLPLHRPNQSLTAQTASAWAAIPAAVTTLLSETGNEPIQPRTAVQ